MKVPLGTKCLACGHVKTTSRDYFIKGVCKPCYAKMTNEGLTLEQLQVWRTTNPRVYQHRKRHYTKRINPDVCQGCGRPFTNGLVRHGHICDACYSLKRYHGLVSVEEIKAYRESLGKSQMKPAQKAFNVVLDRGRFGSQNILIVSDFQSKKNALAKIISSDLLSTPLLLGFRSVVQTALNDVASVSAWANDYGYKMQFLGKDDSGILCFEIR